ncbi:hypothetical protein ERJ75_001811500 [Trypanosoma vivax]|nr:hypothetical protein ERJ75_001811500 [Trypanosoma vivax]
MREGGREHGAHSSALGRRASHDWRRKCAWGQREERARPTTRHLLTRRCGSPTCPAAGARARKGAGTTRTSFGDGGVASGKRPHLNGTKTQHALRPLWTDNATETGKPGHTTSRNVQAARAREQEKPDLADVADDGRWDGRLRQAPMDRWKDRVAVRRGSKGGAEKAGAVRPFDHERDIAMHTAIGSTNDAQRAGTQGRTGCWEQARASCEWTTKAAWGRQSLGGRGFPNARSTTEGREWVTTD